MKKLLISLALLAALFNVLPASSHEIKVRSGLDNSLSAISVRKEATVAFLGGSITEMEGWRNMVQEYLVTRYPETKFHFIDAGISSLGSTPHAFRFERDVLEKGIPDLLFVEAAVNDNTNGFTPLDHVLGMEGIVRHALKANPYMDIVFLHFIYDPFITMLQSGEIPDVILNHERVANHYHLPSIDLASEVGARLASGEFDWEKFGGTHPAPFGHRIYADAVAELIESCSKEPGEYSPALHPIPTIKIEDFCYENGREIPPTEARKMKGFRMEEDWVPTDGADTRKQYIHIPTLVCEDGGSLVLEFDGTAIGLYCTCGPNAGTLSYTIDGNKYPELDTFTQWSRGLHIPWVYMLAGELAPGHHVLKMKVLKGERSGCYIKSFVVNGENPSGLDEAEMILDRQTVSFISPPERIPAQCSVDAPLMGNGFTGVALAGPPESLEFYISRNDFWRLKSAHDYSYPLLLGKVTVSIPALKGGSWQVDQRLYDATTVAHLGGGDHAVTCRTYVAATEDMMVSRITNEGKEAVSGTVKLSLPPEGTLPEKRDSGTVQGRIRFIERAFTDSVDIPTRAAAAMLVEGGSDGSFTLEPGGSITIACAFSSNFKSDDCLKTVIGKVSASSPSAQEKMFEAHRQWWKDYWHKSYVRIPDSVIERQYYLSLYGMASCSRDADFPPPLFGTWITKEPPFWMGDYHLNYNHMAPYYALCSANRIQQADPYYAPLLDAIPRGEYYSEKVTGIPGGILLPVGIGPKGIETTHVPPEQEAIRKDWIESGGVESGGMFWGQKSNSAYAVTNISAQFYTTLDEAFARKVYPFVKGVATFWENYLSKDGDRYVIYNDAIHEGTVGTMNPLASLGLVRLALQTACDMSEFLGVDADRRPVWKERREHLSDYPLQERDGKTVFRYTERGVDWWPDNTLGIQHIYPAGQIGLDSDGKLLEIARNTIEVLGRWSDFNGTNSFYPAAVRVGYDPQVILSHLHDYSIHTYRNGFQFGNPHGTENWSTVPNTINEMLCMGHQGVVRLFPVWPRSLDASFHQIRLQGAFLVSASLSGGQIGNVTLVSEKGSDLVMENPWPGHEVIVTAPGGKEIKVSGNRFQIGTTPGGIYRLAPGGMSE